MSTYGDSAKTKTITRRKYARIVALLRATTTTAADNKDNHQTSAAAAATNGGGAGSAGAGSGEVSSHSKSVIVRLSSNPLPKSRLSFLPF